MAKLIVNFSALLMIILLVSNGLPKAVAQTCFKGEAQEGVCVKVDGSKLCDLLCRATNTTWFGACEVEDNETHCHCYGPC
ncbi:Defensin-like (DEFL) family protein [Arabidopsis thaliana]|uniref:Putative defensin-like protein 203 n=1 Tax=Arabidopsis thaliana TaxID=3702 RepID=DF203_ARATH|nr:Defensin-like (DEFL) family protein [Arabidopsis thaliana]Q2V424.1 RecName: Full=Putative defensin-like protein 203; Flags: Precursor [Arabidopsis thaliana]AEC09223.1 Defensin-like (DEFL) family protein [Arabidopsis thaliana]|eukprot:NP_001031491.1 Defensin-like (DEFL) family protein [Arabidopsis thaliana]